MESLEEIKESKKLILEFKSPACRVKGENKSKLLLEGSEMYDFLYKLRLKLKEDFPFTRERALHVELSKGRIEEEEMAKRVGELEGQSIQIGEMECWNYASKAFMLRLPPVQDFHDRWGGTHCTVAFFTDAKPESLLQLFTYVQNAITQLS